MGQAGSRLFPTFALHCASMSFGMVQRNGVLSFVISDLLQSG